jgi:uncharacterized protein (TIGR02594 family)
MNAKQKLAFEIALGEYGHKERRGGENPEILKYFHEIGYTDIKEDEVPWCSAFVNWCVMKAGLPITKNLAAKSWLGWGKKVMIPEIGDIAVFKRGNLGWQGHAGFYIKNNGIYVWVLSGNQSDEVNISKYSGTDLLSYRRYE